MGKIPTCRVGRDGATTTPVSGLIRGTGVQRANRLTVILLGLQRLSYLAPAVLAIDDAHERVPGLTAVLIVTTVAWNVAMFAERAADRLVSEGGGRGSTSAGPCW